MSKVVCLECKREMDFVNVHHLSTHNITPKEYQEKYGKVKLYSDEYAELRSRRIGEVIKAMRDDTLSVYNTPEHREIRREISKKAWKDPQSKFNDPNSYFNSEEFKEERKKIGKERSRHIDYSYRRNFEYRKNMSDTKKRQWEEEGNGYNREKYLIHMRKIRSEVARPTKIELKVREFLENYELPYQYVGDGSLHIHMSNNGKEHFINPDFVHIEKQIVIEVLGDYWHSPLLNHKVVPLANINFRKKVFKKNGWKIIPIWTSEFKNLSEEKILEKINNN